MVVKGALLLSVIYQNYYFNSQTAAWFFDDSCVMAQKILTNHNIGLFNLCCLPHK